MTEQQQPLSISGVESCAVSHPVRLIRYSFVIANGNGSFSLVNSLNRAAKTMMKLYSNALGMTAGCLRFGLVKYRVFHGKFRTLSYDISLNFFMLEIFKSEIWMFYLNLNV